MTEATPAAPAPSAASKLPYALGVGALVGVLHGGAGVMGAIASAALMASLCGVFCVSTAYVHQNRSPSVGRRRQLASALLHLLFAVPFLVFAFLLVKKTHHRGLGGTTFAIIAVGAYALGAWAIGRGMSQWLPKALLERWAQKLSGMLQGMWLLVIVGVGSLYRPHSLELLAPVLAMVVGFLPAPASIGKRLTGQIAAITCGLLAVVGIALAPAIKAWPKDVKAQALISHTLAEAFR